MAHEEKPAIKVNGVSKTFRLPHERYSGLKQKILGAGKGSKGYEVQKALNDVSFEITKGEFFGIVGKNGSGKSTLLKTIAGIYSPSTGKITVNGKLVPFIELGVGFNPELTGRENVFLNGALLGFSHKEMGAMYDEIVEFAELERFMDQKLKNYSSGMQVRLAFSIAIRAQGDILLLDEVLAVGDSAFRQKCFDYFSQLRRDNKTVVLVTHGMDSVQRFCTRALMLEEGKIKVIGNTGEVAAAYEEANRKTTKQKGDRSNSESIVNDDEGVLGGVIRVLDHEKNEATLFHAGDKILLEATVRAKEPVDDVYLAIIVKDSRGQRVCRFATEKPNPTIDKLEADVPLKIELEIQNIFAKDTYEIDLVAKSLDYSKEYFAYRRAVGFEVAQDPEFRNWSLRPNFKIRIGPGSS